MGGWRVQLIPDPGRGGQMNCALELPAQGASGAHTSDFNVQALTWWTWSTVSHL